MSDSAQIIMCLDPPAVAERLRAVEDLTRWLVATGVIAPFDGSAAERAEFARSDWSPGSNWRSAVDEVPGAVFETLWLNGVDVTSEVGMQSAYGNFEEWTCPGCGTELLSTDLIESWIETRRSRRRLAEAASWRHRSEIGPPRFRRPWSGRPRSRSTTGIR